MATIVGSGGGSTHFNAVTSRSFVDDENRSELTDGWQKEGSVD
jgi:hypothetical protein